MDPAIPTSPRSSAGVCCTCGCPRCSAPSSPTLRRSVKRKSVSSGRGALPSVDFARVDVENEVAALRETLASQQGAIKELSLELEEERNAAATAASETMSMILRLQREKAEVQMEARQFRRFAEEKMAHDDREIAALEDLLFKRDQEAQALSCEVRAYRNRLLSLGVSVGWDPISPNSSAAADEINILRGISYPPLRCDVADHYDDQTTVGLLKNMSGTSELHSLEQRIYELEKTSTSDNANIVDPQPRHLRKLSTESSFLVRQDFPAIIDGRRNEEDDETDRIYTIDAIHGVTVGSSCAEGDLCSPMKEANTQKVEFGDGEDGDIKKLYMRLQTLEADRESMRQAIISMRTEKAQFMLLREIAQQLCKEVKPERRVVKKRPSLFGGFSFLSLINWVILMPFMFWRKKASRSRYTFGLSSSNTGLLQIMDKSPQMVQWRCLTRTTPPKRRQNPNSS